MSIDTLKPVSIEFLADRFPLLDITFVTNMEKYEQHTQTVPGIFIDVFKKISGNFWFILMYPNGEIIESYRTNRIPTIESIKPLYGGGCYKAQITEAGKEKQSIFFTI